MTGETNNSFGIANVIIPAGGPKCVPVILDWNGVSSQVINASQLIQNGKLDYVQALYVDNADNPNALTIVADVTNQRIIVPANSQGYFQILSPNAPVLHISTTAGNFQTPIQLLNVPVQPYLWSVA